MSPARVLARAGAPLALALGLLACSSDGLSPTSSPTGGGPQLSPVGTLTVHVHDDKTPELRDAEITFVGVEARPDEGDSIVVRGSFPRTLDVTDHRGIDQAVEIARDVIAAGEYRAIRIGISRVYLRFDHRLEFEPELPSQPTVVELPASFRLQEGGSVEVFVDVRTDRLVEFDGEDGWTFDPTALRISAIR